MVSLLWLILFSYTTVKTNAICPLTNTPNPNVCFNRGQTAFDSPCTSVNINNNKFYHPSCTSCCKFIQCDASGVAYERDCAPGTVWCQEKTTCAFAGDPGCTQCGAPGSITDYTLVNMDGAGLTASEANDYCKQEFGRTLATINTQSDYDSARNIIDNNGAIVAPWIGLVDENKEPPFFTWKSGDSCEQPDAAYGACVSKDFWIGKRPINCDEDGSDCVIFYPDGFNNDKECDTKRVTFLCNGDLYTNNPSNVVPVPAHIANDNKLKVFSVKDGSYFGGMSNLTMVYVILGLSVICNVVYLIHCLCKKYCKKHGGNDSKVYDMVGDEDEVEPMNDI